MQKETYNVQVREHTPWDPESIQSEVDGILDRCQQLYPKLLDSMQGSERAAAVRNRVLCERGESTATFARNHPRLFGLITQENTDREQVMTMLRLHQSDTDGQDFAKRMLQAFTKS
jgi:hypothetical protein